MVNRRHGRWAAVAVLAMVAGCGGGGGGGGSTHVDFVAAPAVGAGPNARAPLVRVVTAETNVPTRLEIVVTESVQENGSVATVRSDTPATRHAVPIIGLKPAHGYDLTVTAVADDGTRRDAAPLHVDTAPLPDTFPRIDVRAATAGMEPGFTMIGARNKDLTASFIVILDDRGEVVWFLAIDTSSIVTPLANGHVATILANRTTIEEIDLVGNTVRAWYAARASDPPPANGIAIDAFTFHNDVFEIAADGTFLVPTDVVRFVDDFPTNENDPSVRATTPVLDEPIIEFRETDGAILRSWNFLDLLKPTRIGFDATVGLPANADWAHTNGVALDGRDDSIITSLRHQDAVVKTSRTDGSLRWILGNHDNWAGFEPFLLTPVGVPFAWPYHQHAPQVSSRGTLLLFDNGNWKASPFTGEPRVPAAANASRAVEYEIDADAKTVRQVWEFVADEQLYAPFVGSAYELPATGNVLITYGGLCTVNGVPSDDIAHCRGTARILEVRHDESGTVVFDVEVADRDPDAIGWLVYRSYRLPALGGG